MKLIVVLTGTHLIRYIFSHMPVHGSHWNVPPGGESGDDELEGLLHESGFVHEFWDQY
jgi:hypothetical protein